MEVEKPEIGGHQRMLVSILGHFRSFFMLVIGSPLYQHFILVQNCHCMYDCFSKSFWCKQYKNPFKTPWRAATGRREARGEDGLLNQLHILMFPSLIQLTDRDHSQHLPPAAVMLWIWPGAIQKPCVVSEAMHQYLLCPAILSLGHPGSCWAKVCKLN